MATKKKIKKKINTKSGGAKKSVAGKRLKPAPKRAAKKKAVPEKAVAKKKAPAKARKSAPGKTVAKKKKTPTKTKKSVPEKTVVKKKAPANTKQVKASSTKAKTGAAKAETGTAKAVNRARRGETRRSEIRRDRDEPLDSLDLSPNPSGLESGDLEGLSNEESADSESVDELLEEGNAFEAGVVWGVEESRGREGQEVRTREVPEDDVPQEYLDEQ
jgi:hypothetical protein